MNSTLIRSQTKQAEKRFISVFLLFAFALPFAVFFAMVIGDWMLLTPLPEPLRRYQSLIDPFVHLSVGLLIASPVILNQQKRSRSIQLALIVAVPVVFIDFDHFIAAGSLSLYAITHLAGRPATHSILFSLVAGCIVWLVTRRRQYGWLVCLALLSHVIRDASLGGTPYLAWPFYLPKITMASYYAFELFLYLGVLLSVVGWPLLSSIGFPLIFGEGWERRFFYTNQHEQKNQA